MLAVAFNYAAVNAKRQYGITTERQKKNVEKLSSGFRINRAADNAAGLSISEKMRKQMRGLSRGTTNAQDGISLLQIADGSLAEMTAMMHRMTELSIQSANGTYSDDDRKAMQDEIKQLQMEINGEVDRTKFNDMPIFPEAIEDTEAEDAGVLPEVSIDASKVTGTAADSSIRSYSFSADETGLSINGSKTPYTSIYRTDDGTTTMDSLQAGTYLVKNNGLEFPVTISEAKTTAGLAKALSRFRIDAVQVPDQPLRQAVSSAEITAGSGVKAGSSVTITADETGINGKSWSDIKGLESLDRGLPLGGDQTISLDLGDGFTLTMNVDKAAGKKGIAAAINGMSASVVTDDSSAVSNLKCVTNRLSNNEEASVNLLPTHSDSNFSWTMLENPATDDASKAVAKKLNCNPTDLVNGRLSVSFVYDSTKTPPTLPTAKFTAEKDNGRTASVSYQMSEADAQKMAEALGPDKEYKQGDIVFDAAFTYGSSTFTAHLNAWKNGGVTSKTQPPANAIMDPGKANPSGAAKITFNMSAGTKIVTSGSLASIEDGNVIDYKYKDSFAVSENGVTEDSETPIPKRTWWIQSGADTLSGLTVSVGKISLRLLGLDDMDISTEDGATKGIDKAAKALDYVSKVRSEIGAQQNRLEHTIANNENAVENTTASESRIRDADMADEMVEFHRNNILELVGESVIAQANSQQQDVLNLLNQ